MAEAQSDTLLKCNQVLYEMMGDVQRSPNEIMPEMTNLIPVFIENLGNAKVSTRSPLLVHECGRCVDVYDVHILIRQL